MIELATIWEVGTFAFSSYAWAKKQLSKEADHAIERVERFINKKGPLIQIHRVISQAPRVSAEGKADITEDVAAEAVRHRSTLELNELHAIAGDWDGNNVDSIRAQTLDFAEVLALRTRAKEQRLPPPKILSAGAVVVCPSARCVLVHRRSVTSATYPNALHILGGAYKPPVRYKFIDSPGDRMSLEFTMVREVFEESGLVVRRYEEPICVAQELDTGFIQYVHLGVRVTKDQFANLHQNSEGDLLRMPFDELKSSLLDASNWVPTGRAHILMWLGLGAPGAGWNARFDGEKASQVFDSITGKKKT